MGGLLRCGLRRVRLSFFSAVSLSPFPKPHPSLHPSIHPSNLLKARRTRRMCEEGITQVNTRGSGGGGGGGGLKSVIEMPESGSWECSAVELLNPSNQPHSLHTRQLVFAGNTYHAMRRFYSRAEIISQPAFLPSCQCQCLPSLPPTVPPSSLQRSSRTTTRNL